MIHIYISHGELLAILLGVLGVAFAIMYLVDRFIKGGRP